MYIIAWLTDEADEALLHTPLSLAVIAVISSFSSSSNPPPCPRPYLDRFWAHVMYKEESSLLNSR